MNEELFLPSLERERERVCRNWMLPCTPYEEIECQVLNPSSSSLSDLPRFRVADILANVIPTRRNEVLIAKKSDREEGGRREVRDGSFFEICTKNSTVRIPSSRWWGLK